MIAIHFNTQNVNRGKSLSSSIQRTLTSAQVTCWKNNSQPLFRVERKGMIEIVMDNPISDHLHSFITHSDTNISYNLDDLIILLNPSSLFLRNPDHLWSMPSDGTCSSIRPGILYMEEKKQRLLASPYAELLSEDECAKYSHRNVSSPGIVAIRGDCVEKFQKVWNVVLKLGKDLDESIREKAVWNKTLVMLAGEMTQKPFERGEVIPVREGEIDWDEVRNACIVSVSDWKDCSRPFV